MRSSWQQIRKNTLVVERSGEPNGTCEIVLPTTTISRCFPVAGTPGIISHNYAFDSFTVNGVALNEAGITAFIGGEMGVPLALAAGDNVLTAETRTMLGPIETVTTKLAVALRGEDRLVTLKKAKKKLITQVEAAGELQVSVRHVKRMLKNLAQHGDKSVVHGLRGQESNRKIAAKVRQKAVKILSAEVYRGFGPTLASEHLAKS